MAGIEFWLIIESRKTNIKSGNEIIDMDVPNIRMKDEDIITQIASFVQTVSGLWHCQERTTSISDIQRRKLRQISERINKKEDLPDLEADVRKVDENNPERIVTVREKYSKISNMHSFGAIRQQRKIVQSR